MRPDKKNSTGNLRSKDCACGGRYKLTAISQFVLVAVCFSFINFPPKLAIVATVSNVIFFIVGNYPGLYLSHFCKRFMSLVESASRIILWEMVRLL